MQGCLAVLIEQCAEGASTIIHCSVMNCLFEHAICLNRLLAKVSLAI